MNLPNLLIAGVPKAATGSLFAYLGQHPAVCASSRKEIKYFSPDAPDGRSRPLEWYERFFAHRAGEPFALEATPSYCYMGPRVIEAIGSSLERPRVIWILRDPVDRLWSAYTFQRSLGHLPAGIDTFEAYIDACIAERTVHPRVLDQGSFKGLSIGMYGEHLPAWDEAFSEDLRVLFFDDLAADPDQVVRGVCGWLGIDASVVDGFAWEPHNPTVHPRSVTLARGAATARGWSKRLLRRAPGLRERLRDTYLRANAGSLRERPRTETTERLRTLYAGSNAVVMNVARRRGMTPLPHWLEPPQPSGTNPA
ncbi:MAG: sulfotransferase domain-containing protein [Actinomycetota bacterium]